MTAQYSRHTQISNLNSLPQPYIGVLCSSFNTYNKKEAFYGLRIIQVLNVRTLL